MKQKPPRWVQITAAVLRRYLALDMAVYAGSATLFLLTASFPLLMWVLMLVNLVPGFSVEGVAELLADFLPQIPEIQTAILGLLQNLSGQSAQFVASLAVLTTIVSASGGMSALQIGLQRLTPGSHRTLLNRLLAIGYTFVFELLLLVMLALQGMHSLFGALCRYIAVFSPLRGHCRAPLQRVASIGRIVSVPLLFGLLLLIYTLRPRRAAHAAQPAAGHDLCNGGVAGLLPRVLVLHPAFLASVVYLRLADGGHSDYFVAVCDHQSAVLGAGLNAEMNGENRGNDRGGMRASPPYSAPYRQM